MAFKLLWLDMEMSGLDVNKEVILEVGAIATDLQLNELGVYHAVVKQPHEYLERMDDWNKTHHKQSGLVDLVPSGKQPDIVEGELLDFLHDHFNSEKVILAGNSIAQDRLFIDKYFKKFSEKLHYRMVDVTGWKIIFNHLYNLKYEKKEAHRSLDDIRESIGELRFYLSFVRT